MAKRKAGLHKKISSIFDGVPLPNKNAAQQGGHNLPLSAHGADISPQSRIEVLQTGKNSGMPRTAFGNQQQDQRQRVAGYPKSDVPVLRRNVKRRRQIVMAMLIPILFAAFIFLLMRAFETPSFRVSFSLPKPRPVRTVDWKIPALYPTTLRDPMDVVTSSDPCELAITAVIIDEEDPSSSIALVSGRTVRIGDTIAGASVVNIEKNDITFEKDGRIWKQGVWLAK